MPTEVFMDKNKRKSVTLRDERGFTLAELMVVVVIIGLLAGIVLPKLFPQLVKGKKAAARAQIESLGMALDNYRLDTGRYPTTQEGLYALLNDPGAEGWSGPYLKKKVIPKDPWNHEYNYQFPGAHSDYDLVSYGRDGTPGGEGEDSDIVSWE